MCGVSTWWGVMRLMWRNTQEAEEISLENWEVGAEPARGFDSLFLRQTYYLVVLKVRSIKIDTYGFSNP